MIAVPDLGAGFREIVAAEAAIAEPDIFRVGSMLSYDERLLLHWAARAGHDGPEAIVDAGCFLGGSTLALGGGVLARTGGIEASIHVYDRFVFGAEIERTWVPDGFGFAVGASTVPAFSHQVRRVDRLLRLHPGDVRAARWDGTPIGVLFIDIAKTWSTGDAVWQEFLPALIPGRSIVIQQDLVHWGHPWCAIVMELLADHFELLGWVWYSSAVYRCTRAVALDEIPGSLLRDLGRDDKLRLLDRCATRFGEPIAGSIRLSGAVALACDGDYDGARRRVSEVRAGYSDADVPFLSEGFSYLDSWIDRVERGVTRID